MNTRCVENPQEVDTWQHYFERTCSPHVKQAIKRAVRTPEVCLEHALTEIEVHKETDGTLPHIVQRAMIFKRFEETRTLNIYDNELIVGNVNSKIRGSLIFGYLLGNQLDAELDDPVYDYEIRSNDRHHISEEERKVIREQIVPFFKGHCMEDAIRAAADGDVKDNGYHPPHRTGRVVMTVPSLNSSIRISLKDPGIIPGSFLACFPSIRSNEFISPAFQCPLHMKGDHQMENFQFCLPTTILFGRGQIAHLPEVMAGFGKRRCLPTAEEASKEPGCTKKSGNCSPPVKCMSCRELHKIRKSAAFGRVVRLCREHDMHVILAVGGSVIDCSKAIAAAYYYPGDAWEMIARHAEIKKALPRVMRRSPVGTV
ncbi:MAG TPA: iron-containing alcohol dehydrogenase [Oscillospiraceae bacterium]|nr:iron-containing alcohol dehydrogenase [Oscillospiraceae bacterium]